MQYAISAGAVVMREGSLLLVHHRSEESDFWLPPGGRLRGEESVFDCAVRETLEETGLQVSPLRIVYIEEFVQPELHFCKFWILASERGGDVSIARRDPDEVHLVDARFLSRDAIQGLRVFPSILRDTFWEDVRRDFPETRYLGLSRIQEG
jgi:8-oxo-dGTP diphosphatase